MKAVILVAFRKDIYNAVDLSKLGLNDRQIKAVPVCEKANTNSEYQKMNETSGKNGFTGNPNLLKLIC